MPIPIPSLVSLLLLSISKTHNVHYEFLILLLEKISVEEGTMVKKRIQTAKMSLSEALLKAFRQNGMPLHWGTWPKADIIYKL